MTINSDFSGPEFMRNLGSLICLMLAVSTIKAQSAEKIMVTDSGKSVVVKAGGSNFTTYDYKSYKKPIFYPIFGPNQIPMTRNYPMKNVAGEANDHPHHKSMWIGHEISGTDFWSEKGGRVELKEIKIRGNGFEASHHWIRDQNDKVILSDKLQVEFRAENDFRWIDSRITFSAGDTPVVFEDTKEGTFAVRVHPSLRSKPDKKNGVPKVTGQMKNARGSKGNKVWGEAAKWVHYYGQIEDQSCGITIFDHPENLRHPTTWHARDYGLFAANPFGLHYFQRKEKGAGEYSLPPGKSLTLRYRVIFHIDQWSDSKIDSAFNEFAGTQ